MIDGLIFKKGEVTKAHKKMIKSKKKMSLWIPIKLGLETGGGP